MGADKVSGTLVSAISKIDGVAKGSIASIMGISVTPPFPNVYSLEFDGIDDLVNVGTYGDIFSSTSHNTKMTYSFWFKTSDTGGAADRFFHTGTGTNGPQAYILSGIITFGVDNTVKSSTSSAYNDGNWHHFLGVYDNTITNTTRIWVDGIADGSNTSVRGAFAFDATKPFDIGDMTGGNFFDGMIDEFAVWESDQSAEVATLSSAPMDLKTLSTPPNVWYRNGDSGTFFASEWDIPDQMKIDNWSSYSMVSDGVTDRVDVPSKNYGTTYTLSCWLKTTDTSGVAISGDSNTSYALYLTGTKIYHNPFGGGYYSHNATVADDVWHHIAIARSGGDIEFYVDGSNVGTTSGATGDMIVAAFFAYANGSYTMVGNMDEIAFFSTQLNSTQVAALWNSGTPLDISAESNLVSYYRLGESAVFNANTEWEIPNYQKRNYFSNLSMEFDGVDDKIEVPHNTSLDVVTGNHSLSFWMKATVLNTTVVMEKGRGEELAVFIITNRIYWGGTNGYYGGTTSMNDGNWHNIIFVADGGTSEIFIDGASVATGGNKIEGSANTDVFTIGLDANGSNPFTGNLDEISIFNTALSSGDVTAIWNSGKPGDLTSLSPVSWWRMGEGSYWNATNWQLPDYSKQALFSQKSFVFDGVDQYIDCGTFAHLNSATTLTVSVWFKSDTYTTNGRLVNVEKHVEIYQSNAAYSNMEGRFYYKLMGAYGNSFKTLGGTDASGVGNLVDGNWHHLCLVWDDATTTAIVYEDGVAVLTDTSTTGTLNSVSDNLYIGADPAGANAIDGNIDDVSVYNVAKSAVEVAAIYNSGVPTDLSAESGLVGYWVFDDATFSTNWTVPDNSTNSNTGTSANVDQVDLQFITPTNPSRGLSSGMDAADVINQAPENMEQGLSAAMDEVDKINNAPDNTAQGRSVNMDEIDRVEDVPA